MSTKVVLILLLAFFVALTVSVSPTSVEPTLIDVTSDTSAGTLRAIQIVQDHMVTAFNACKDNIHIDRILLQEVPEFVYRLTTRVEPCIGSSQSSHACTVYVQAIPNTPARITEMGC